MAISLTGNLNLNIIIKTKSTACHLCRSTRWKPQPKYGTPIKRKYQSPVDRTRPKRWTPLRGEKVIKMNTTSTKRTMRSSCWNRRRIISINWSGRIAKWYRILRRCTRSGARTWSWIYELWSKGVQISEVLLKEVHRQRISSICQHLPSPRHRTFWKPVAPRRRLSQARAASAKASTYAVTNIREQCMQIAMASISKILSVNRSRLGRYRKSKVLKDSTVQNSSPRETRRKMTKRLQTPTIQRSKSTRTWRTSWQDLWPHRQAYRKPRTVLPASIQTRSRSFMKSSISRTCSEIRQITYTLIMRKSCNQSRLENKSSCPGQMRMAVFQSITRPRLSLQTKQTVNDKQSIQVKLRAVLGKICNRSGSWRTKNSKCSK